jgi:hypothetical protein
MRTVHEPWPSDKIFYCAEPHSIGIKERQFIDDIKNEVVHKSNYETNLVINITWFDAWDPKITDPIIEWVLKFGSPYHIKVWICGSVDGTDWFTHVPLYRWFNERGYKLEFVGFGPDHWYSWIPAWLARNNKDIPDINYYLKNDFKYLYLCYNRKPRENRIELVKQLISNHLLGRGWVTFDRGHFVEVDNRTGDTDQDKHTSDLRWSRPEDLMSCGDLNTWRDCYSVIVTETEHSDPWQLSEKTWKPILGLRPFLLNSHSGVINVLNKLGLYTPVDFFNNTQLDGSIKSVINQLKILALKTPEELHALWLKQLPMLEYNRKRIFEIEAQDPSLVLNWSQAKPKPHSVPVSA